MKIKSYLITAKQKAHLSKGSNFYVTKQGIKRDFNLMGAKYEYKVYCSNDGLYVEDYEGNKIEKPTVLEKERKTKSEGKGSKKTTISSELRDATTEKVDKNVE
jgi:hypothetical protein